LLLGETSLIRLAGYVFGLVAILSLVGAGLSLVLVPVQPATAAPLVLLDNRGWEMVSPVEKNGGEVQGFGGNFGGDVLQAAADGESATFSSASSFGGEAQGAPIASQYVSRRRAGGWSTQDITQPTLSGAYSEHPEGVPFQLFAPDLGRALMLDGNRCAGSACPSTYTLRESTGALTLSPAEPDLRFAGSSPDLRHVALSTCAALTSDATEVPGSEGCDPAAPNLYDWSGGQLRLLNLLPGDEHGTPGARLAAHAGAVSTDGWRVYWTASEDGFIYLREDGATKWVSEATGGTASFQTATPDGAFAFFTSISSHLYRYRASTDEATDLTPGGEVLGVLGTSTDGSRVYYLTAAGLFLWDEGTTRKIAAAADASNYPPTIGTARVSADGTRLAFLSKAPLTGYDNTDQYTGNPDSEVFLYDATANGALACISCNPSKARPIGPSTIPGAVANGASAGATRYYKPRAMAADGRRLFFDSHDALVSQDTNNDRDVYEWEAQGTGSCTTSGGCLNLISSGRSEDGASFVDASEDGRDAFFLTDGSLIPSDPLGTVDLYDAREGGGFPIPPTPIPCEGDSCQPLPSPPEDPTPGTQVPTGGNPPVHFAKKHKGKRRHHKKHRHHVGRK
jgi:hypothetical protein